MLTVLSDCLERQFDPYSPSAAAVLLTLLYREQILVTELARILRLSQPAATRAVDKLEAEGLVARMMDPGRAVPVRLTATGQQAAQTLQSRRLALCESALGQLPQAEKTALDLILTKVLTGLVEDRGHARQICRFCDHAACDGPLCPVGCAAREIEDRSGAEVDDVDRS